MKTKIKKLFLWGVIAAGLYFSASFLYSEFRFIEPAGYGESEVFSLNLQSTMVESWELYE